jgi:hypothetical protein
VNLFGVDFLGKREDFCENNLVFFGEHEGFCENNLVFFGEHKGCSKNNARHKNTSVKKYVGYKRRAMRPSREITKRQTRARDAKKLKQSHSNFQQQHELHTDWGCEWISNTAQFTALLPSQKKPPCMLFSKCPSFPTQIRDSIC